MSAQGEHIFNAIPDLLEESFPKLDRRINPNGAIERRTAAAATILELRNIYVECKTARDNQEFRSAPIGHAANSYRYSQFCQDTRDSLDNIMSGVPDLYARGYTILNKLLNDFEHFTTDQTARKAKRDSLASNRRQDFDNWYNKTYDLKYASFKKLRDAAIVVNATREI